MSDRDESDRNEWIHGQQTFRIDSEFDRLANRMTWLIGANACLFTGFLNSLRGVSRADMAMGGTERLVALSIGIRSTRIGIDPGQGGVRAMKIRLARHG